MKTQSNKEAKDKQSSPELPIQRKGEARFEDNRSEATVQRKLQAGMKEVATQQGAIIQAKANNTGLPNNLKSGIENLSGFAMDDVKVHYNSSKPAQLQAHAYAQGSDIHLAPGQEKHLAHEAWHVVQQKQGRVKPTRQLKSKVAINDDDGLEKEADVMGAKAMNGGGAVQRKELQEGPVGAGVVQRVPVERPGWEAINDTTWRTEAYPGWEWILEDKGGQLLMRLQIIEQHKSWVDPSGMEFLTRHGEMTYEQWKALGRDSEKVLENVLNPNVDGVGPDTTHPHAGLAHWEHVATVAQNGRGLNALQDEMWGGPTSGIADTFGLRSFGTHVGKRDRLAQIDPALEALIAVPALMIDDDLFEEFLTYVQTYAQNYDQDREGIPFSVQPWYLLKRFARTKGALKVYRALVLDRGIVGARPTPRSYGKLLAAHCVQRGAACNLSQQPGNMELTLKSHVRSSSTQPRVFQSVTTQKPLAIAVANKQLQQMRDRNNKVVVLFTMAIPFLDMVFFNHVDPTVFATELVEWGKGTEFHENRRYDQATEMIVTGNIPQKDILSIEIIDDHAKYGVVEEDGNKF